MATVERIDFNDLSGDQPELICSFFWSEPLGVRCSSADMMEDMERNGIATPPEGVKVYPRDGRPFFDALKWRGSSFLEVTAARVVSPEYT